MRKWTDFFTKRLDHQTFGKENELGIHILTVAQAKESLRAMSLQKDDLVLLIPDDALFYTDIKLFLQTDTYVKQNGSNGRTSEEIAIVTDKSHQNQTRFERIKRRAQSCLVRLKCMWAVMMYLLRLQTRRCAFPWDSRS